MSIFEAIFRDAYADTEELIFVDSIEKHKEFNRVRSSIFCTYENCEAQLEYVPQGKRKAHFKTWPKQDHTPDCIDYFEREKKARGQKNSATTTMALSDKHIADVLNDMKRKRKSQEDDFNGQSRKTKKNKKNKTVDPSQPSTNGVNIVPTTGLGADMQEGEVKGKSPSVRRRTLLLLNDDDIGFTRAIPDGLIESIDINTDRVVIAISSGSKSCNIYFEEFFFSSAPANFIERFKDLEKIFDLNIKLNLSCVGEVVRRNNELHLLVNKHIAFRVEDLYLTIFLDNYNRGQ